MQDAAQGLAPCLEAAQASRGGRPAGTGPGLAEGQASRHKPCAIGAYPDHQIGMAKALTAPGLVAARVQTDARDPAHHGDARSGADGILLTTPPKSSLS